MSSPVSYKFSEVIHKDGRIILRPMLPVRLQFGSNDPFDTDMLVDSGADFSMISKEVAEDGLGIDVGRLKVEKTTGVGGQVDVALTEIYISFGEGLSHYEFPIPVQINLQSSYNAISLLGRYPLFYEFDVNFRMGYCENKGKFVLKKVTKRRPAESYG